MSKGKKIIPKDEHEFNDLINNHCCIMEIEFKDIISTVEMEFYISKSKCLDIEGCDTFNGRITSAKRLRIAITELDLEIINKMYTFASMTILNMYVYKRGYLPTNLVKAILELYKNKTELKGIPEKVEEYLKSKGMINAAYGMCVMDPVRDEVLYLPEEDEELKDWKKERGAIHDYLEKYNTSKSRFLFYPWGIYVTALARYNLFTGILEMNDDYIYSDTDSLKILNRNKHSNYFRKYNNDMIYKLHKAMTYHNLDDYYWKPKNLKGDEQILGLWDYEGTYKKFKTLGAKRYMMYDKGDKEIILTFAGLNKITGMEYFLDMCNIDYVYDKNKKIIKIIEGDIDKVFDSFKTGITVPVEYAGRKASGYIDFKIDGNVTDYFGVTYEYHEDSAVNMTMTDYTIKENETMLNEKGVEIVEMFKTMLFGYSEHIDDFNS